MTGTYVELDLQPTGVSVLRLCDEPGKNALSQGMVDALTHELERASRWPEGKVLVLAGLPEVFCAGAPRDVLESLAAGRTQPADLTLPRHLLEFPLPIIAAMEGHAVGGGLALGVCADIVLLARESRYGCSFMELGFTPGMGITRLLEHVLSPALAHELMYTAELVKGSRFDGRAGFNYVLPKAEVFPKALELAERIAEKPRSALLELKRTLSLPRREAYDAAFVLEAAMHEATFAQRDLAERIRAAYVE